MINLTQSELTRQERLLIWLYREGITKMQIAKAIGVSPIAVTLWFQSERIPKWMHKQLVDVGIPYELLKEAVDIARGPRPKESKLAGKF